MNPQLKIGFLVPSNAIAGGVFVVYLQAQYLKSRGHQVFIIFQKFDERVGFNNFHNFDVERISMDQALHEEFDVVIATWWNTVFSLDQLKAKLYLYFVQSDERRFYIPSEIWPSWVSLTYSLPQLNVITEARWIKDFLAQEFNKRAEYAPNGVDTHLFTEIGEAISTKSSKRRILIEGPPEIEFKKVADAFRITNALRSRYDFEVWYVSSAGKPKREWQHDRFFEAVPYREMPKIYRSCDILIKISSVEGFFGPPLEMMACGGTCIVSNVTGYGEYIEDEKNALVISIGDVQHGMTQLERLLDDSTLLEKLKAGGRVTAKAFEWRNQYPKFEAAIQSYWKDHLEAPLDYTSMKKTLQSYREIRKTVDQFGTHLNSSTVKIVMKISQTIKECFPGIAKLIYKFNAFLKSLN